jgi:hypothetical protein
MVKEDQAAEAQSASVETATPSAAGRGQSPSVALASQVGNRAFSALALSRAARPGQPARTGRATPTSGPAHRGGGAARPKRASLARYQQGEAGHGGIEEEALSQAGFSAQEVKSTYFGNWLRDWSQIGEPKRSGALMDLINILAWGEFNRGITEADLGTYVASEHLDNPEGGGSVDDPAVQKDPAKLKAALEKLSPDQKAAYERERAAHEAIIKASELSGLPPYIEQGKMHAREELAEAVTEGETAIGMRALGNGLHAVEDYFSHSNFTEACIVTLAHAHDPTVQPLMDRLLETSLGHNLLALVPEENGRIQIQTGTYGGSANKAVSAIESLETELTNGELRRTFIKGSLRVAKLGVDQVFKTLAEQASALAPFGGIVGAGSALAGQLMQFAGKEIGAVVDFACNQIGESAVMKAFSLTVPSLASLLGPAADTGTAVSGLEAAGEGLKGPTHSQLAKDSPDNPLYEVSRALAVAADKEIGEKIKEVWAAMPKESKDPGASTTPPASSPAPTTPSGGSGSGAPPESGSPAPAGAPQGSTTPPSPGGPGGGTTPEQLAVTSLVDKFVSNPADNPWWEPVIQTAATKVESG